MPVENVIAETLAKSPPSFRVLIIYCGRRWGEGEREEREGLYFISFCRGSGRGRREEGNLGDLAVRLSPSPSPGYNSIFFLHSVGSVSNFGLTGAPTGEAAKEREEEEG